MKSKKWQSKPRFLIINFKVCKNTFPKLMRFQKISSKKFFQEARDQVMLQYLLNFILTTPSVIFNGFVKTLSVTPLAKMFRLKRIKTNKWMAT